jgi:hypothetical protein
MGRDEAHGFLLREANFFRRALEGERQRRYGNEGPLASLHVPGKIVPPAGLNGSPHPGNRSRGRLWLGRTTAVYGRIAAKRSPHQV